MSVKLTDAQLVMMSAAAQREDRCFSAPATIKGAALGKVGVKLPIPTKPPVCNGMIAPRDSWMMPPPCNEMIPPGAPRLLA